MSAIDKELSRLYAYAMMLSDQDTRDSQHEGMKQEMVQLYAAFGAEASYIEPEILRFPKGTIEKFLAAEPRLKVYEFYLKDIERRAAHTLSETEEKLLADAGPLAGSPSSAYGILANADLPYPTVTLSDGKSVKLDQAAYNDLRALPNRADREKVMSAFFKTLGSFSRTFGTTMNGEVQKVAFLYEGAEVLLRARVVARRRQHPDVGLHAPGRRREQEPAGVPPVSQASQAHARPRRASLLRSVRAARRHR